MICRWSLLLVSLQISCAQLQLLDLNLDIGTEKPFDAVQQRRRPEITILGALSTDEHIRILTDQTNRIHSVSSSQEIVLSSQSFLLDSNPLMIAMKLCDIGNASHAKAIIAGRGLDGSDLTLTAISYVSDFYHVPVLTIASRENLFSDKVGKGGKRPIPNPSRIS